MRAIDSKESAFTLIEVLVAGFVIAILLGVSLAMISSSSSDQSRNKIRIRQQSVARQTANRLTTQTGWIEAACGSYNTLPAGDNVSPTSDDVMVACHARTGIDSQFLDAETPTDGFRLSAVSAMSNNTLQNEDLAEHEKNIAHDVRVKIYAHDRPKDSDVGLDKKVDLITILVTDSVTGGVASSLKPYTYRTTINMRQRRGDATVNFHACSMTPQADERISMGTCNFTDGAKARLNSGIYYNPEDFTEYDTEWTDPNTNEKICKDYLDDEYTEVLDSSVPNVDMCRVVYSIQEVNFPSQLAEPYSPFHIRYNHEEPTFKVTGPMYLDKDDPHACDDPCKTQNIDMGTTPELQLRPGTYRITDIDPDDESLTLWKSHSNPGVARIKNADDKYEDTMEFTVKADSRADVTFSFKPVVEKEFDAQSNRYVPKAKLTVYRFDVTDPLHKKITTGVPGEMVVKMVPAPNGRLPFVENWKDPTNVANGGWTKFSLSANGQNKLPLENIEPGLYMPYVIHHGTGWKQRLKHVTGNGGNIEAEDISYVWVHGDGQLSKYRVPMAGDSAGIKADNKLNLSLIVEYCDPAGRLEKIKEYCTDNRNYCKIPGTNLMILECPTDSMDSNSTGSGGT